MSAGEEDEHVLIFVWVLRTFVYMNEQDLCFWAGYRVFIMHKPSKRIQLCKADAPGWPRESWSRANISCSSTIQVSPRWA